MVLYDMQKDDNYIFKNNQDRRGTSYLSRHLSFVKQKHLLASPVKLIFCGLSPFYKTGAIYCSTPPARGGALLTLTAADAMATFPSHLHFLLTGRGSTIMGGECVRGRGAGSSSMTMEARAFPSRRLTGRTPASRVDDGRRKVYNT
jgi:hypothetical protein